MSRFLLAWRCFFSALFTGRLPREAARLLQAPTVSDVAPELATTQPLENPASLASIDRAALAASGAVQLLSLLQREGRLIDFLQEEIDGYSDAQIGAAVRDVHRGCKKALADHVPVEPVLRDAESATVRVDAGFDPSTIRLVGRVVGSPPFTGTLRHHGWRASRVALADARLSEPQLLAPAEVELV